VSLPLQDKARIIATALARLAGEYEAPTIGECRVLETPEEAVVLVYKARRGEAARPAAITVLACTLASWTRGIDPSRLALTLLRPDPAGLHMLYKTLRALAQNPSPEALARALQVVGGELRTPCARDPVLEEERGRLEARMKALGILLGVSLPLLFLASFYVDLLLGLAVLVATAALWYLILAEGSRFRRVNIEAGWRACVLSPGDLERILSGAPDAPTPFEILGIPRPELE